MTSDVSDATTPRRCPSCRASIDDASISDGGTCVFCGAAIAGEVRDAEASGVAVPADVTPPQGSKIQVIEASDTRLVLYIPPSPRGSRALGVFALIWNALVLFISCVVLASNPLEWTLIAFFSLFWIVGIAITLFWLTLRFTRTFVLIDREQVAVQRLMFNRKRTKTAALEPGMHAQLVTSHEVNNQPVHAVEITRGVRFGTSLEKHEKDWLVDVINRFLRYEGAPAASLHVPGVEEMSVAPLSPAELPAGTLVEIVEDSRERLHVRYRAIGSGVVRKRAVAVFLFVSAALLLVALFNGASAFRAGDVFDAIFGALMLLASLLPAAIAYRIRHGMGNIEMTAASFDFVWSSGRFRFHRAVSLASINRVALHRAFNVAEICVVNSKGLGAMPIALSEQHPTAREVAGLIAWRLGQLNDVSELGDGDARDGDAS